MKVRIKIEGQTSLYIHNARELANPLSELSQELKKLTGKTKKTATDYKRIARLEFEGGLYYAENTGVFLPTWNVKACFINGAKLRKMGASVERAFYPIGETIPLIHEGPKTPDELWEAGFYRIDVMALRGNRISRTRPFFERWGLSMDAELYDAFLDLAKLTQAGEDAGVFHGLGDSRKLGFGRFSVEIEEI